MTNAIQPVSIIPVNVLQNWTNASLAAEDCIASLEASFPGVFQFPMGSALILTGVQVQGGITAKATLSIAATTQAGTWSNSFGTVPVIGSVAYIIDMY
jgi:hypothetical protein